MTFINGTARILLIYLVCMITGQAFAVGVAGVTIGCVLGWGAVEWFDAHPIFHSDDFVIRPEVNAASFYEPAIVVLLTTVLAAAFPAFRATQIEPSRVLRGNE